MTLGTTTTTTKENIVGDLHLNYATDAIVSEKFRKTVVSRTDTYLSIGKQSHSVEYPDEISVILQIDKVMIRQLYLKPRVW